MRATFNDFYNHVGQQHEAINPTLVLSCLNQAVRDINQSGITMLGESKFIATTKTNDINTLLLSPIADGEVATYLGSSYLDMIKVRFPNNVGMTRKSMDYLDNYADENEAVYWLDNNLIKLPLIKQTLNLVNTTSITKSGSYAIVANGTDIIFDFMDTILPIYCNVTITDNAVKGTYGTYLTNITRNSLSETTTFLFSSSLVVTTGTITSVDITPIYIADYYAKIDDFTFSNTVYIPTNIFNFVLNKMYACIYLTDEYLNIEKANYYNSLFGGKNGK